MYDLHARAVKIRQMLRRITGGGGLAYDQFNPPRIRWPVAHEDVRQIVTWPVCIKSAGYTTAHRAAAAKGHTPWPAEPGRSPCRNEGVVSEVYDPHARAVRIEQNLRQSLGTTARPTIPSIPAEPAERSLSSRGAEMTVVLSLREDTGNTGGSSGAADAPARMGRGANGVLSRWLRRERTKNRGEIAAVGHITSE